MFYTYYTSTNGTFGVAKRRNVWMPCCSIRVLSFISWKLNVLHLLYIYKWHIWSSQEAECMDAMLFHKGAIFYLRESNSFQLVSSLYYFRLISKERDKNIKISSSSRKGKTVSLVYDAFLSLSVGRARF